MKSSLKNLIKDLQERFILIKKIWKAEAELYRLKKELKKQEKEDKAKNKTSKH